MDATHPRYEDLVALDRRSSQLIEELITLERLRTAAFVNAREKAQATASIGSTASVLKGVHDIRDRIAMGRDRCALCRGPISLRAMEQNPRAQSCTACFRTAHAETKTATY